MTQALSHIQVLDLSRILAGPWCTQNLADLGADVIKVERPGVGDDTRSWGPPWISDAEGKDTTDSGYYSTCNRNKRSVTINIATSEGQGLVEELAKSSDVFIENYKRGDMERYGLDYESIRKINPRIVYCSITGYGQDGPYADKPGYDFVFQGMGGIMSLTGERDDLPGGGPQKVGVALSDILTGMYASVAILAALEHRNVSGVGQYIDMALLDCTVAMGSNQALSYLMTGEIPGRYGNAHAAVVPYQVFATSDGHVIVTVGNDGQWQRYCQVLGRPDIAGNEQFATASGRITNRAILVPQLAETMRTKTSAEWLEAFEIANVPCGPINNYKQVFENPQVKHRRMHETVPRADGARVPTLASPLRLKSTPPVYRSAPPQLGEHTDMVLAEILGKSDTDIQALRAQGVV